MTHRETKLRKDLAIASEPFKTEPDYTRLKARSLYKVALEAIEACERTKDELDSYKTPKLFEKNEQANMSEEAKKRIYHSRIERLVEFLRKDAACQTAAFQNFLKWNRLTLEKAKQLVAKASEVE